MVFGLRAMAFALALAIMVLGGSPLAAADAESSPLGAGWTQLSPPEEPVVVGGKERRATLSVAAGWASPCLLYAGAFSGLYRSEDCGSTWRYVPVPRRSLRKGYGLYVTALAVDRTGRIYVGGGPGGVMISPDGGQNWQEASGGPTLKGYSHIHTEDIFTSPAADGVAYAWLHQESLNGIAGFARTDNGGLFWRVRNARIAGRAVDPFDPEVVYAFGIGSLLRSTDGGLSFEPYGPEPDRSLGASAVAMSHDGSRFWWATGRRLFRSLDRGQSWEEVEDVPYQGFLTRLSASPHDPRVLFAVTNEGDLWAYREPGAIDFPIPNGHFFTQTDGQGGASGLGFAVTDQESIPFFSTFTSLSLQSIGYPISHRFTYKGFITQLFQKLALQWQPDRGVQYVNLFDELHVAGKDPWLEAFRSIPSQEDTSQDNGLSWDQVVARHVAILERDPALKEAYLSEPRWLELYGLPMGYADYPAVSVVRGQRAALQRWKVEVPWAKAGEVTIANGGDIAKEAGLFPEEALLPQPPP